MGSWFWLNFPLMLVFFCCSAGIPLWFTLTRWHRETEAKHAEVAARAALQPVVAAISGTDEALSATYAAAASSLR
jgi:hypothetical protein